MTPNYHLLANYLVVQSRDRVAFTFAQLEGLVGGPLPRLPGRLAWRRRRLADGIGAALAVVGWQVDQVDMETRVAVFTRPGHAGALGARSGARLP